MCMPGTHPFDAAAVSKRVSRALQEGPPGTQAALARVLGVTPTSVNRWAKRHTVPDPTKWAAIEHFFGWEPRTLLKVAGTALGSYTARPVEKPAQLHEILGGQLLAVHRGICHLVLVGCGWSDCRRAVPPHQAASARHPGQGRGRPGRSRPEPDVTDAVTRAALERLALRRAA